MTTIRIIAIVVLLALSATSVAQKRKYVPVPKKLYCWTENGHKVCGDALPAEAAERARTEISARSGLRTGEVARALTEEERAAAAATAGQARVAADAEAARQRRDLAMVESYNTEADLRRAYGERISLLDASLKSSALGETNLRRSLISLLAQASDLELAGKPVSATIVANLRTQHGELHKQKRIFIQQRQDRAALDGELNDAVSRYRALKRPTGAAPAATPEPATAANG
ncbi:MAG: hypothetical protein ABIO58_02615 [Luteimonas sp.]